MGSTVRFPDWHRRLIQLIESRKATPFAWGRIDCCLWAADAALAMTGIDHAHDLRGTYTTARGARSALRFIGGLDGAGARAGPPIGPLFAATGDIGIVHDGERDVLAVCIGECWMVAIKTGLGTLPLAAARRAWRVA